MIALSRSATREGSMGEDDEDISKDPVIFMIPLGRTIDDRLTIGLIAKDDSCTNLLESSRNMI